MVARDHPHLDAGRPRAQDGVGRLRAWRVEDADERKQREAAEVVEEIAVRIEGLGVEIALRRRHHPEPVLRQLFVGRDVPASDRVDGDCLSARVEGAAGPFEQLVGRTLDVAEDDLLPSFVCHLVVAGHQLVGRIERKGRDAGIRVPRLFGVDAALGGEDDERSLGRVAHELPVMDLGVRREHHRQQERVER